MLQFGGPVDSVADPDPSLLTVSFLALGDQEAGLITACPMSRMRAPDVARMVVSECVTPALSGPVMSIRRTREPGRLGIPRYCSGQLARG